MASIIKLKRSSTATAVPGSLQTGEIAVNLFDRKLYVGNGAGVTAIGGEDFRLTTVSSAGAEGAFLKLIGGSVLSTNSVFLSAGEGLNISRAANGSLTFAGEDATTTNKGVASFDTNDFGVSSGAVSLNDAVTKSVAGDSGTATPSSHSFTIAGTSNEITTSATGSTVTIGLPDDVTVTGQFNVGENIVATGNGSIGGTFGVTGATTLSSTLGVDGTSALNAVTATTIQANGNITASSGLTVTGATALNGGLTMDTNKFAVADTTGNVTTAGTLTVAGTSSLNGVTSTSLQSNGNLTVTGTSTLTGNVTAQGDLTVNGDTLIDGNLTVEGALTYISTSTVYTDDGMFKLSSNNAADSVDSGIYAKYISGATTKYAGYFRDASDGIFKFYKELQSEPSTTVDVAGTGYALAQVDAIIDGGSY